MAGFGSSRGTIDDEAEAHDRHECAKDAGRHNETYISQNWIEVVSDLLKRRHGQKKKVEDEEDNEQQVRSGQSNLQSE